MAPTSSRFDPEAVRRLAARAEREVTDGLVPACQFALACDGDVVERTIGASDDARFLIFSLTKSLVAGAMWLLLGDGSLSADTRVADVVPEFGTHGKHVVTVEHLLTHTAGFPAAALPPEEGATSAGRVARFAQWRLDFEPGSRTAYHPTSAHWVLAELIERVTRIDYRSMINDRVADALGLATLRLGVTADASDGILDVVISGAQESAPGGTAGASPADAGTELLLRFNEPAVRAIGVPGAGAVGTAADLARYFQAMLHNPGGLWNDEILRDATSVVRNRLPDPFTNIPVNRTLGLMMAGDDGQSWLREFGSVAGPRSFLSSGAGSQVVWADPDTGLSFCFVTNGIDIDAPRSFLRTAELCTLAAACIKQ